MGKRLLADVVDYLYGEAGFAQTVTERDAFSLALAICGAVRREEINPLNAAAYRCFGSPLPVYLERRAQRISALSALGSWSMNGPSSFSTSPYKRSIRCNTVESRS